MSKGLMVSHSGYISFGMEIQHVILFLILFFSPHISWCKGDGPRKYHKKSFSVHVTKPRLEGKIVGCILCSEIS